MDANSDPSNCGVCGNVCPTGTTCNGGSCSTPELIGFDDLPDQTQVPNGYDGLNWNTFYAVAGSDYSFANPNAYGADVVSPPNVAIAFDPVSPSGSITAFSTPQFDAISLYATTSYASATMILAGSLQGSTPSTVSMAVSNSQATFINLGFTNIDTLVITLADGMNTAGNLLPAFAIEDFSVNLHAAA